MALTIEDNRSILNEADATTGWTSTDGPTVFTTAPAPMEAGGCLALQASNSVENAYIAITSDDYSGGGTLSIWIQDRAEFELAANTGIGIQVGDGTNRIAYSVGGSDGTAFRHDVGPVKWACFLLDLANKPANFVVLAGAEANLNEAAITQVGLYVETLVKSVGGADNVFWDIIRFADNGVGIEVYGGTVGTPETLSTLATADRSTANQAAHGIIRELGAGVYGVQGNINLGDNTSTNDTYIDIDGETIAWEDRGLSANNYYRFAVAGNGTGTTVILINASTLTVPTTASASFDSSDTNVSVDSTNSVYNNFDQGVTIGGAGDDWTGNTFNGCGVVTTTGSDMSNCKFNATVELADGSALFWNSTTDIDGLLDGTTFTKGSLATHAIEFPTGMTNTTISLNNAVSTSYNASNAQNDSFFNVLATTGTLTINVSGGTGNFSYKTAGATVIIVEDPITVLVNIRDNNGVALQNANVWLKAADGAGNLPFEESVTIARATTVATVTHTAHGLNTGEYVKISGITDKIEDNNGAHEITVVDANSYTYVTTNSGSTSYTGTIIATGALLYGLTDVSGNISKSRTLSLDQEMIGSVRKSTASPNFKSFTIAGTVSSTANTTLSVRLVLDE
jgi:hypothetical protein